MRGKQPTARVVGPASVDVDVWVSWETLVWWGWCGGHFFLFYFTIRGRERIVLWGGVKGRGGGPVMEATRAHYIATFYY